MDAWERFLHAPAPDLLVQLAVAHAEFEAIHPFLDGNGRLGRLIVPLFLQTKGLLSRPNFYLSEYLESRREKYYDRLLAVSRDGDWTGWCLFFLRALTTQAETNQARVRLILALYKDRKTWIATETRSQYAVRALDWIFTRPVFVSSDFVANTQIPAPTANRILRVVRAGGLIEEVRPASGQRPALFRFPALLDIVEGLPAG
jgi:Fic family protein